MPLVQVSMLAGRSDDDKRKLLHAIHEAVRDSIGASESSIKVWISEFQATEYISDGVVRADRDREAGSTASGQAGEGPGPSGAPPATKR
jgi:4-oxalocrotonate tautomerase